MKIDIQPEFDDDMEDLAKKKDVPAAAPVEDPVKAIKPKKFKFVHK